MSLTIARIAAPILASALCAAFSTARAADAGHAYVSNQNGEVSVIDLATMTQSGTVEAYGEEPRGIGVTADGKLLVLANREGGRVAVIDRASGKLLRHVKVGENPEFVRTRGHLAFVSYEPSSTGGPPPKSGAKGGAKEEGHAAGAKGKDRVVGLVGDDDVLAVGRAASRWRPTARAMSRRSSSATTSSSSTTTTRS
jgi:hypothetical protein